MYKELGELKHWHGHYRDFENENKAPVPFDPNRPAKKWQGYNEMIFVGLRGPDGHFVLPQKHGSTNGYEYCLSPFNGRMSKAKIEGTLPDPVVDTGYELQLSMPDDLLKYRFLQYDTIWHRLNGLDNVRATRNWWWEQCRKFGVPLTEITDDTVAAPLKEPTHLISLIYMGFADFLQRGAGICWLYDELYKRCPGYEPFHLFQVAHMLPWCFLSGSEYRPSQWLKPEWDGTIAQAFSLTTHGENYQFGRSKGIWNIVPTFQDAVDSTILKGSLNDGFFPASDTDRVPRPDWSFDKFAEFARFHIDHCLEQEVEQQAALVCG